MVTGRVARGTALTAVAILIAVLAMLSGHQQSQKAEAVDPLTVGLDFKSASANASTYTSTLPTFEKCVDVKTAVNDPITPNGIFYLDLFVLNTTQLQAANIDLTFTSGKMSILQASGRQFFGTGTTVNTYGTNIVDSALGTVNPGVSDGAFSVALLDTGSGHTGSGVLIRFKAQGNIVGGGSVVTFNLDLQPSIQHGVTLTDSIAAHPGDTNADGLFDGPYINSTGTIAIDRPDGDADTISDTCDNCPSNSNTNQLNTDGDSMGNVCDPDDDNDGILDGPDVCETVYDPTNNPASCADSDSDGIFDGVDNCPTTANANQANNDGDSQGDLCDTDDDNDGVNDGPDNCDYIANPTQADWNSNGVGDACEDSDGDGWTDSADNCKSLANPSQSNTDGDSYGNLCDNCPLVSNSTQADIDGDFLGDHCDNSDSDLGTWYDNAEIYLLTNRTVKCPATTTTNDEAVDAWPPDMNDNRLINGQDILVYNYVFGKLVTATPVPVPGMGSPDIHRFDLSYKTIQPGSGVINGQDILQYNSIFGSTCTP